MRRDNVYFPDKLLRVCKNYRPMFAVRSEDAIWSLSTGLKEEYHCNYYLLGHKGRIFTLPDTWMFMGRKFSNESFVYYDHYEDIS